MVSYHRKRINRSALEFAARMEGLNPDDPKDFRKAALFLKRTFASESSDKPAPALKEPAQRENKETKETPVIVNAPLDFELKGLDFSHPYLSERGFTDITIRFFGLGYCNRGLMKGRIVIPLNDPWGRLIGYSGRIVDESTINEETPRYLFPSHRERNGVRYEFHKSEFLYNGHRVKGATDLVVVESFTAVWWLGEADIENVVALMGASCSEAQAKLIQDLVPEDGRVWVLPDGDPAGERMAESVMKRRYSFFDSDGNKMELLDHINILDKFAYVSREDRKNANERFKALNVSRFSEAILTNLKANRTKPTYFETILSIKGEIAAVLYARLDIILSTKDQYERTSKGLFEDLHLAVRVFVTILHRLTHRGGKEWLHACQKDCQYRLLR